LEEPHSGGINSPRGELPLWASAVRSRYFEIPLCPLASPVFPLGSHGRPRLLPLPAIDLRDRVAALPRALPAERPAGAPALWRGRLPLEGGARQPAQQLSGEEPRRAEGN